MIEAGLFVAIGLLVILSRLPWKWRLLVISHPLATDLAVFILLTALHWGTFSGVMAATIGAMTCSLVLSLCKRLFGCYQNGSYKAGWFSVGHKL